MAVRELRETTRLERPPHPEDVLEYMDEHWEEICERYPDMEDSGPGDAAYEFVQLMEGGESQESYDTWSRDTEIPVASDRYVNTVRLGEAEDDSEAIRLRGELGEDEELTYLPR